MTKNIFDVRFKAGVSKADKLDYLNLIKNEWEYPSVTNFLNTLVIGMKKGGTVIIDMEKLILEKLDTSIKKKNYNNIEDWFMEKIREEIQ